MKVNSLPPAKLKIILKVPDAGEYISKMTLSHQIRERDRLVWNAQFASEMCQIGRRLLVRSLCLVGSEILVLLDKPLVLDEHLVRDRPVVLLMLQVLDKRPAHDRHLGGNRPLVRDRALLRDNKRAHKEADLCSGTNHLINLGVKMTKLYPQPRQGQSLKMKKAGQKRDMRPKSGKGDPFSIRCITTLQSVHGVHFEKKRNVRLLGKKNDRRKKPLQSHQNNLDCKDLFIGLTPRLLD